MAIINIAYLIDTMPSDTSGTEKQLLGIIERIDRTKFLPHLICLYESAWMREYTFPCSCTVLGYNGLLKFNLFGIINKLRSLLVKKNIHII